jgi:hypothetical protein
MFVQRTGSSPMCCGKSLRSRMLPTPAEHPEPRTNDHPTTRRGLMEECLVVVVLLCTIVCGWRYCGQPVAHPYMSIDSAVYLSGAASFASGGGYGYAPLGVGHPIGFYPPGQSAFLSLFWATTADSGPYDYRLLWSGQTLLALLLFAVAYSWFRTLGVPRLISSVLIANVAWSPVFAWIQIHLYSDAGFALFAMVAVLFWRRCGVMTPIRQLFVGCCIGLSILWRTQGIVLLGACAVALMATKEIRSLRAVLMLLVPGMLAVVGPKLNGGSGDTYGEALGRHFSKVMSAGGLGSLYLDELRFWVGGSAIVEPVLPILNRIPSLAARVHTSLQGVGAIISSVVIWMLAGVTLLGVRTMPRQQQFVLLIGAVAYVALIMAIPMPPFLESGSRYMFPLVTMFVPFAYLGVIRLLPALSRSRTSIVVLSIFLGSLAWQGLVATRGAVTAIGQGERVADVRALALMCRNQLPPGEPIAVSYDMPVVDFWCLVARNLVVDPKAHSRTSYLGPSHDKTGGKAFSYRLAYGPPWPNGDPVLRSPLDRWRIYPASRGEATGLSR